MFAWAVILVTLFSYPVLHVVEYAIPVVPLFILLLLDIARGRYAIVGLSRRQFSWLWSVTFMSVLIALYRESSEALVGTVQLLYSLVIAYWFAYRLRCIVSALGPVNFVENLRTLVSAVLIVSLFEALVGIGWVTQYTDELLHQGVYISENVDREYALFGYVRPRLLFSEPSHLAKALVVLLAMLGLGASNYRRLFEVLVLAVAALLVVRSPILLSVFVLVGVRLVQMRRRWMLREAMLAIVVIALAALSATYVVQQRYSGEGISGDLSTFIRVAVPVMALDVLSGEVSVIGYGFGAQRELQDAAFTILEKHGFAYVASGASGLNNGLVNVIAALGYVGSITFFGVVYSFVRDVNVIGARRMYLLVYLAVLLLSVGAVHTPMFWLMLSAVAIMPDERSLASREFKRTDFIRGRNPAANYK